MRPRDLAAVVLLAAAAPFSTATPAAGTTAPLDPWDLGAGALDNGANVALALDPARQVEALGLRPARAMRFNLWNGGEQGMYGSAGYVRAHAPELGTSSSSARTTSTSCSPACPTWSPSRNPRTTAPTTTRARTSSRGATCASCG